MTMTTEKERKREMGYCVRLLITRRKTTNTPQCHVSVVTDSSLVHTSRVVVRWRAAQLMSHVQQWGCALSQRSDSDQPPFSNSNASSLFSVHWTWVSNMNLTIFRLVIFPGTTDSYMPVPWIHGRYGQQQRQIDSLIWVDGWFETRP